jgi:hypothetical protein
MAKVSLSGQEQSIEFIWGWYEDQKDSLFDFRNKTVGLISNFSGELNSKFLAFTSDELNDYFEESHEELERLVCFDLISATEGLLRSDFYSKVYNKDKSEIGKRFRELYKLKENNISLEQEIIENWKEFSTENKSDFSRLLGLLKYRHWLAHGRYWTPRFGQPYNPETTYEIAENILEIVRKN